MNPDLATVDRPSSFLVEPLIGNSWHYITSGIGVILFIWTTYHALRKRDAVPLMMYLGGLFLSVNDPLYNHLFHIRYADNIPGPAFVGFGIATPGFMPMAYAGFSILGYWVYLAFRHGVTRMQIGLMWVGIYLIDVLFEGVPAALGSFTFDGAQPFEFAHWGYYLGWINATGFMSIGWLLMFMLPKLEGWQKSMLLTVPMIGHIGAGFCVSWPIFIALNWEIPTWAAWLLATFSLGLSLLFTWCFASMVAIRREAPARG